MSIDPNGNAIAVMVKITGSAPTSQFPHRIEIEHYIEAGLDKESYAEVDSYATFDLAE
jgi:hypothetical protein